MATEKQIAANRINGLLGGVRTEQGKRLSSRNATKYGFFSRLVIESDKISQEAFCREIYETFAPANLYEAQLVEVILSSLIVYRRICIIESELTAKFRQQRKDIFSLDVTRPLYENTFEQNFMDELTKFQRYKTCSMNLAIRTQHELERLSRMRQGEHIPPPVVCDLSE